MTGYPYRNIYSVFDNNFEDTEKLWFAINTDEPYDSIESKLKQYHEEWWDLDNDSLSEYDYFEERLEKDGVNFVFIDSIFCGEVHL